VILMNYLCMYINIYIEREKESGSPPLEHKMEEVVVVVVVWVMNEIPGMKR